MTGPIRPGAGTPEEQWQAWSGLGQLPVLDVRDCRRAVVVAPHPDDETLAVGGLMALLLQAGADFVLVAATDGEASHPGSTVASPQQLRAVRTQETEAALLALGGGVEHRRLHLPDGRLAAHEQQLAEVLTGLLGPDDWCIAPYERDAHPDHDAGGRAAGTACAATAARLLRYPLWAWNWAVPDDPRLPWDRAHRLPLPEPALRCKRAALSCYPSQTEPLGPAPEDAAVVPPGVLAHFLRDDEVLFT